MITERRTKRRFAHELYPHPQELEIRPLAVDVPYLYARALGFDPDGTSWFDLLGAEASSAGPDRILLYVSTGQAALAADAMLQGLTGDEAYRWVQERCQGDNLGEFLWERGTHYGVDPDAIKPYPCGPEPERHNHLSEPDSRGYQLVTIVAGRESECEECTEPVPNETGA